ncbi:MAG TPA: TolC family protein [Desulfuromonadales bacterium]|nr:TolC family protein [Desulfuromonadales bacterium]
MKIIHKLALLTLLLLAPDIAYTAEIMLPGENLATLVESALSNNPEIKASESRWQMFASKVRQVSALEDPMIMLKLQNMAVREPFVFNKDPQSAKIIGISQQLPFWGKRALRKEVAVNEAESWKWAAEERKLELTRMVKENYYQLWAVDKGLATIDNNLKLLTNFVKIAELKYSVSQGVQQDIYKAGLEKSKMLDMQITMQQQRRSLEANLNYLLFRPANTQVGSVADFSLPQITLTGEQLNEIALTNRPQLKSLVSISNKAEASRRLASREGYPDFNLSLEYMFRDPVTTDMATDPGDNMFSLGVTFNLPIQQGKRSAMRAESMFESTMAREELNALKNTISYTINETLAQLDRLRKLLELYKGGIIPQAGLSLESALISYRVNKVDFMTLLDSRMTLFNYERELYESKAEYMMKVAQLEAIVGTDLITAPKKTAPTASRLESVQHLYH